MVDAPIDSRQSAYHMAFQYLERIHEILKALDNITVMRARESEPRKLLMIWTDNFSLLNSLYKELVGKMSKAEIQEQNEAKKYVENLFNSAVKGIDNKQSINIEFLKYFDAWEMELRILAENKGLLMPDKKDITEAQEL